MLPVTVEDNKDGTYDVVVSVPYSDDLVPVSLDVGLSDSTTEDCDLCSYSHLFQIWHQLLLAKQKFPFLLAIPLSPRE